MLLKKSLLFVFFFLAAGFACAAQTPCADGNISIAGGFVSSPLPQEVIDTMRGKSYPAGTLVPLEDLRYVRVKHFGFDGQTHDGEIVVHKDAACDAAAIFQELYALQYPIEKIRLIDHYGADDHLSMADNNSSSFCWRLTTDGTRLSYHALGLAVDINPLQNPYLKGNVIDPIEGKPYIHRLPGTKGMIFEGDAAVTAFKKRGWKWGGDWMGGKGYVDWQHFEKPSVLRKQYTLKLRAKQNKPRRAPTAVHP